MIYRLVSLLFMHIQRALSPEMVQSYGWLLYFVWESAICNRILAASVQNIYKHNSNRIHFR